MWVLIRADANVQIGSGHIMRCLTLANRLSHSGLKCVFLSRALPEPLHALIESSGHTTIDLPSKNLPQPTDDQGQYGAWLGTTQLGDAQSCWSACQSTVEELGAPEFLLVDHYGLDQEWETIMAKQLNTKVAVIDDLSNRNHVCNWLIDTTFGKTSQDYKGLVPEEAECLIGAEYALLRPEFTNQRSQTLRKRDGEYSKKKQVARVLVAMGGMDKDNVSALVLEALETLGSERTFKIDVLISSSAPHLDALQAIADSMNCRVKLLTDVKDVAALLETVDLCIGAAGSSTWERCCLGLPTINMVIADNQTTIAEKLSQKGAIIDAGQFVNLDPVNLAALIKPALDNVEVRQSLSEKSRQICDGRGAERVSLRLQTRHIKEGRVISLREATGDDIKLVYNWQLIKETREYANNQTAPIWPDHQKWMKQKLLSREDYFYIILCDQKNAGVIRLDQDQSKPPDNYIVSIFIDPHFYGLGAASAALEIVSQHHSYLDLLAQVNPLNKSSLKLFARAGYKPISDDWYRLRPRRN